MLKTLYKIWLFNSFFFCIKRMKFEKAEAVVSKLEKINACENLLSGLMKTSLFYAMDNLHAYRAVSQRVIIFINNSETINKDEKKYLTNFVLFYRFLEMNIKPNELDDSFSYKNINSLYLSKFPYKKFGVQ